MYISKINIKGFRNFADNEIEFNDGVNVVIGHNNAGKTSLLKAIGLIINNEATRRLEIDDFSKNTTLVQLQKTPPVVEINLTLHQSEGEDPDSEDLVTVSNWLTKLENPYEALLTYVFFLPQERLQEYNDSMSQVTDKDEAWLTIKHEFLRLYSYKIFGGDPSLQTTADHESLQKFDYQFLNAIRDVERDMFSGKNTLLRDVLDFFMDYEIKSADPSTKQEKQKKAEIKVLRKEFSQKAGILLDILHKRMDAGKKQILSYANQTGATFNNAAPDFDGTISDVEMYSALKLIIGYEALDLKIPASHNGLGYNNLIFMSLLLAKMQVNSDGTYLGGNAKVFPVLVIEEPEAHLHPAMQYKFLKFLKENKEQRKVRQVFVTSHSTQITSAVSLDEIICLHNEGGIISVGYPGKTFPKSDIGEKAKAFVQRYLDATRSDMLFAQRVILVEGMAEQLLLPTLAKYCQTNLEDHHVAIIPVGGRFFDNFLYMFDTSNKYALPKKLICLKDRDPERRKKGAKSFSSTYPFLFNHNTTDYDYQDHISAKVTAYDSHANIRYHGQNHPKGKTFEYELCFDNLDSELLLTPSIKNREELQELFKLYREGKPLTEMLDELRVSGENANLQDAIGTVTDPSWTDDDKKKAIIASRYLASVGKGENALELANILEANIIVGSVPTAFTTPFTVPSYIKESIDWICQ